MYARLKQNKAWRKVYQLHTIKLSSSTNRGPDSSLLVYHSKTHEVTILVFFLETLETLIFNNMYVLVHKLSQHSCT